MEYYVVIDTNVLVSALLKWDSVPGKIITECLTGELRPLINAEILSEYQEVLARPKFKFPKELVEVVLDGLIGRSIYKEGESEIADNIPDPDDAIFYAVVMESRETCNSYLITGNLKHFPEKPFIVTPRDMLSILCPQ